MSVSAKISAVLIFSSSWKKEENPAGGWGVFRPRARDGLASLSPDGFSSLSLKADRLFLMIRADLDFEALAGLLKGLDELHCIIRMDIVVRRAVVEHETASQVLDVVHGVSRLVSRLVLLNL